MQNTKLTLFLFPIISDGVTFQGTSEVWLPEMDFKEQSRKPLQGFKIAVPCLRGVHEVRENGDFGQLTKERDCTLTGDCPAKTARELETALTGSSSSSGDLDGKISPPSTLIQKPVKTPTSCWLQRALHWVLRRFTKRQVSKAPGDWYFKTHFVSVHSGERDSLSHNGACAIDASSYRHSCPVSPQGNKGSFLQLQWAWMHPVQQLGALGAKGAGRAYEVPNSNTPAPPLGQQKRLMKPPAPGTVLFKIFNPTWEFFFFPVLLSTSMGRGRSCIRRCFILRHPLNPNGVSTVKACPLNRIALLKAYCGHLISGCLIKLPNMTVELVVYQAHQYFS